MQHTHIERGASAQSLEGQLTRALDAMPVRSAHIWLLLLVSFGALLDAMTQANIGLVAPRLADLWGISALQIGLLSTLTFFGMAIGSVLAGYTNDRYGRKFTYTYNLALFTVGSLVAGLSGSVEVLLIARFMCGIGLGGELSTALTLISEVMPTRIRGAALGVVNVAAGGLGLLIAPALVTLMLGPLEPVFGGPEVAWRWVLGIMAVPALAIFVYRIFLPESPRFLLAEGNVDEANSVLTRLSLNRLRKPRGMVVKEFIKAGATERLVSQKVPFSAIFQGELFRRTAVVWTVIAMTFGAQLTILVFMPTVLVSRGYDLQSSLLYTTIINIGGLVGALMASYFGYRVKRRAVLGFGSVLAIFIALAFGYSETFGPILFFGGLLQVMFILLNTTAWMWAPELYPTRVRGFGTGCAVTVGFLSASIFPLLAGYLFESGGVAAMFAMIAVMYVVMALAVMFGPETHGKSLESVSGEEAL
ncbi:MFS transporter [Paracoccus aerius]|uniref:MFS transporter n=1 Tax=Paracoccus aerius TaxID=1915382 RepID=A0ABS1S9G2_9RHOB|nr:MFS transporter [Paracoccus aerius]MBL3675328.1 MFS transporter [Paracoccus aerius]GHG32613.1 MFS transporter [Paracoccus aerius]